MESPEAKVAFELESALRTVLERDELRLVCQPLIDLPTGTLIGVEALPRWDHPTLGLVPPLDCIPLAEPNGTIIEIGAWVLDEACRQLNEVGGGRRGFLRGDLAGRRAHAEHPPTLEAWPATPGWIGHVARCLN